MKREVAMLHIRALPHTWSSRMGTTYVACLYQLVGKVGFIHSVKRSGVVVGVISGIGRLILTLVVAPEWQGKGVGRELVSQLPGQRYVYTEVQSVGFYEKMGFVIIGRLGKHVILRRDL